MSLRDNFRELEYNLFDYKSKKTKKQEFILWKIEHE